MSSTSALKLNTLPSTQTSSIGAAVGEVAIAFKHLASAVLHTALAPATAPGIAKTAFEEAEAVRNLAAEIQHQDPGFAQDLFAAADRHVDERIHAPVVLVQRELAHVWAPYTLDYNGKRLHCGVDSFGLAKVDGVWKLTSLTWTAEPKGCAG